MMLNKSYVKFPLIYLFAITIIFLFGVSIQAQSLKVVEEKNKNRLTYDLSVSAVIVPLFTTDSHGNPVHDLKQNELELLINDRPVPFMFNRYQFETSTPQPPLKPTAPTKPDRVKHERRVVFIILDAIFNNSNGFHLGKKIITQLVKKTITDDHFIVILLTPSHGLQYVAGPLPAGRELLEQINGIELKTKIWRDDLFSKKEMPDNTAYGTGEKMQYMATVKRFGLLLSQFQNALKTITNPKIVFLVSAGVSHRAREAGPVTREEGTNNGNEAAQPGWRPNNVDGTFRNSIQYTGLISKFHLQYLEKVSRSINRGGGVLYTINPTQTKTGINDNQSGEMSLNLMAKRSGGMYFQGSKVENVIKAIKRSTAAYYEMTFDAAGIKGRTLVLRILCKRPGIRIHTLRYAAKATPYAGMNRIRKKLFALNAISGGTWSRMSGIIKQAGISIFKTKGQNTAKRFLRVKIPIKMQNQEVDVFFIESSPKTKKVYIQVKKQLVKDVEQIEFMKKSPTEIHQYIALIEPGTPFCIFSRIN